MSYRPDPSKTAAEVLRSLVGRFIILNVKTNGRITSVCVNIERSGSAAWRRKESDKSSPLIVKTPGFDLTEQSLILSYDDVNVLADNFRLIREAIPPAAVGPNGNVAVGRLPKDGPDMRDVLSELEKRTSDICSICEALTYSLDTPSYTMRRALGNSVTLMCGDSLSDYSRSVLAAFVESQNAYGRLPQLTGFGTDNVRGQDRPAKRDALLRWYMQHNPINPLGTNPQVDFVSYELKPLNIADSLNWTCSSDPRKDSVDLLLRLNGSPVFTEVKMGGDKFTSSAIVQVLYYASILANPFQVLRLNREVHAFTSQDSWLCVVVEERSSSNNSGFGSDLEQSLAFLRHADTQAILAPFCAGCAVLVIREDREPFCRTRNIPAFRVEDNGQHFIAWRA